ncbi:MAG: hypothetical protein ABJB76_04805 [Candidatus Nitrosocosmicus sp.]
MRTFFSNSDELSWVNGLVCVAEGIFNLDNNCFISSGYEWPSNGGNIKL